MNNRSFTSVGTALLAVATLLVLLWLMAWTNADVPTPARAAPVQAPTRDAPSVAVPTVTEVAPSSAANDLDTPIVVTGTDFAVSATVQLDGTSLDDAGWVSSATLTATVPWGLDPGVYTLTVTNPGEGSGSLTDAFTVTQGLGVWTTGGPYGGVIHQVLLHPVTPTTVYAVAPSVGVFASYDAGATWEIILRDDKPTRLVIDVGDPDVMYYGRGELLRTTNGGITWESLPMPFYFQNGCSRSYPATHPISPGVVYLGVGGCGEGIPAEPGEGGVCWSDDYGSTWVVMTAGLTDTDVTDIVIHPDDPDKILVGTQNGNLFLSTDGGQHWNWTARLASTVERLYFNPFGTHEAWATTAREPTPPPYLYKSADPDLAVWTPITVTDSPDWCYPVHALTFVSDTIWAAASYGFTSTDGGANWSMVGWAGPADDEVNEFAMDPNAPDVVYSGGTAGVFKSSDGGGTWSEMNEGLAAVIPQALAVPRTDLDTIYAYAYARGLLKSDNGGRSWMRRYGRAGGTPSPGMLAVDPVSSTRLYLGHRCHDFLCLYISEDAGATWREVTDTVPSAWSGMEVDMDVVAPHPLISGTILAGTNFFPPGPVDSLPGGIFVSDNHGETWQYRWPTPTQPFSSVVEFAYDAVDPDLIYVGTGGTGLWKSTDGGETWQPVSIAGVLPPIGIESVASHPDISHTVYVRLYSSAATPNPEAELYVSRDAGTTWTQLQDVSSGGGVDLLFAPPQRERPPYILYTGCITGLCRSVDGGQSWEQIESVPRAYVLAAASDDERVVVYVGTPGGVVVVEDLADRASQLIPGRGSVMGGGVYRMTSRLIPPLYLPLMFRDYTPQ